MPQHLDELRHRKEELIDKTKAAVQDRLTKEINYWDHRATQLKDQELAAASGERPVPAEAATEIAEEVAAGAKLAVA